MSIQETPPSEGNQGLAANRLRLRLSSAAPWVLGVLGLLATIAVPSLAPSNSFLWTDVALGSVLIALLSLSPIPIGGGETILAHSVSVAVALAAGPSEAAASLIFGLILGRLGHSMMTRTDTSASHRSTRPSDVVSDLGQHLGSLVIGILAYRASGGSIPLPVDSFGPPYSLLALGIGFLLAFSAMQWIRGVRSSNRGRRRSDLLAFVLFVVILPLPYAIVTAAAARSLGQSALLILGGGAAVVAPVVRSLMRAESDLERRIGELSTLSEVSQAMRTSLNLEAILHTIYLQVAHLLNVRNFYVALYDQAEDRLSYPLAIKGGNREHWPSRAVSDRLTDRVILGNEPILIPHNAPQALREMGLPELRNAPESWLGVPLQSPSRVLGCIGVFHLQKEAGFSNADRDVLITLAGQASVAIENALLYEETRRRAQALASLNEITTQMSSSLDPEQTLQLVSQSLTRGVGGDKAAIYLTSQDGLELDLVQSTGLPEDLQKRLARMPLDQPGQGEAYHQRRPIVYPHVEDRNLPADLVEALRAEGITGNVDVPLTTPSGTLGMASVFFGGPVAIEDEQLGLLEVFVAQSAIAVANARAHAETDQALKRQVQQLSRLESIGREMVSTLDPDALFESILDSAMSATGAHIGHLAVADHPGQELTLAASRGYAFPGNEDAQTGPLPAAFGLSARAAHDGRTLIVEDVRKSPEHVDWTGGRGRSLLAVPIERWGRALGVITVESEEIAAFGEEQARFLSQVAAYAAVAITNASLYQQLEDHLREQSLLYQASAQIATSMDVNAVAMAVADSLAVALDASSVAVHRYEEAEDAFENLATAADGRVVGPSSGSSPVATRELRECLSTGMPLRFERARNGIDQAVMVIPLAVSSQPIGAIEIEQPAPHTFSETEIRTAQTIASQAAIALQNTDLFRRIQESHDRLVAVLNSTQEAILMVDRTGHVLLTNRQFESLLGVSEQAIVGAPLLADSTGVAASLGFMLSDAADPAAAFAAAENAQTLHLGSPQEKVLQRVVQSVLDTEGQPIGWLLVLRDITEERELDEAREQLTEMIVHDLRSPLTTILGGLSMLEKALPDERPSQLAAQALHVSRRSVDQMLGLVNSLLDLARLETNPLELHRTPVSVDELLRELTESFIPEANESGLILDVSVEEVIPIIEADREKIQRVFSNLLDNAVKFTPEGGRIGVHVHQRDSVVEIVVADSGPGVPADMRERIFDRFAQVPGSSGRRRGTGLGLAFAKLAIEAHGGRIWVDENQPCGSAFHLELPLKSPEPD
ncbi:MAG: GAF domain-containing protein [Anaerolineales bacterium]